MNYKFKTKPYAHQLTALEKSWNRDTLCILHGNGDWQNESPNR